jgi:signal transduction histidine kinase
LTRIRTELETTGAPAGDGIDDAVKRSVLDEIDELTALVDDLLVLARSDTGEALPERRPVDLDDLVFDEVEAARATAAGITIDASRVSAAEVLGSQGELRRLVRNLLDNAVRHAASHVTVTLIEHTVDAADAVAVLTITDDGPGIPPEQTAAVFERFTRLDDARTRHTGGTGLGLAIASDIVDRHRGTLRLDTTHRPGARFEVRLPATVTRS